MLLRTRPETSARRAPLQVLVDRATPAHLALARTGSGALMVLRPRAVPQALGVDSATATRMAWAVQMLGARELALGIGTWTAMRNPDKAASRLWVAGGVLSDGIDAMAVTAALLKGRVSKSSGLGLVAVAAGAVALGVRALQEQVTTV
ncbi:MAG: hypothetical protein JWM62_951 [Frankiales bacterium]|jgi:hypothetical protein|nr:hypothetical protein [Frankiales bacterium]